MPAQDAYLGHKNPRLHTDEVLMALTISALTNPLAELAQQQLPQAPGLATPPSR